MSKTLAARLRASATGRDEWRVQSPADGSYFISFTRDDCSNPEAEAKRWLAEHRFNHPENPRSQYVVACFRVRTDAERLMIEAAEALEAIDQPPGGQP